MRNLTIKRTKSFVGCLAKMKVYIEDNSSSEIINNTFCRKIGELKNGEEKTFEIDNESQKVYVIADKLSKNFCFEFYEIPKGEDDIYLTGKNKYNPIVGNPFRFDNNDNPEVIKNRKKNNKKGLVILLAAMVVGFLVGGVIGIIISNFIDNEPPSPKTFQAEGMSITLTDEFEEVGVESHTIAYGSSKVAVLVLKEPFSLADGFENLTLEEYSDLIMTANNFTNIEITTQNGVPHFVYVSENPNNKSTYKYFSYLYKTDDAFWMIQFAVLVENEEECAPQIKEWAKTIKFS